METDASMGNVESCLLNSEQHKPRALDDVQSNRTRTLSIENGHAVENGSQTEYQSDESKRTESFRLAEKNVFHKASRAVEKFFERLEEA